MIGELLILIRVNFLINFRDDFFKMAAKELFNSITIQTFIDFELFKLI